MKINNKIFFELLIHEQLKWYLAIQTQDACLANMRDMKTNE